MNAIERLRKAASGERGWAFLGPEDCAELLQEIDRMRGEAAETREACARICDERAKSAAEGFDPFDEHDNIDYARRIARADEAEDCAAAIRARGKP